jgi:hypothetical protein
VEEHREVSASRLASLAKGQERQDGMLARRQLLAGGALGSALAAALEGEAAEIAAVRDAQKTFLRANGKFPDFIDVGLDVWLAAHDWHVRWQQPLSLGRDAQGRYTVTLLGTTLVMRIDATANFVGIPYDGR